MTSAQPNPIQTTDAGIPVESDEYSLTVGAGGPILLQDSYLIEQMAQFNRERITERQPHAKGSGAFGRFEVTNDVSAYTKAEVFQPGTTTRLVARFSTVAGERGSPDMWRDLRGFALKFYTSEGNYDLVGNDTPIFFVKDPIHFQNFIRSQKRLAKVNLRSNDMQWDFWTLLPEAAHQVVWLMGARLAVAPVDTFRPSRCRASLLRPSRRGGRAPHHGVSRGHGPSGGRRESVRRRMVRPPSYRAGPPGERVPPGQRGLHPVPTARARALLNGFMWPPLMRWP